MTSTEPPVPRPTWISEENRLEMAFAHRYLVELPGDGKYLVRADDERRAAEFVVEELGYVTVDEIAERCWVERAGRCPGTAAGKLIARGDFDDPLPEDLQNAFEGKDGETK